MLDYYCERCGPGLLAEPINACTNGSFLVAAWAAWALARRAGALSTGIRGLISPVCDDRRRRRLVPHVRDGLGAVAGRHPDPPVPTLLPLALPPPGTRPEPAPANRGIPRRVLRSRPGGASRFPGVLNGSLMYAPAFLVLIGLGLLSLPASTRRTLRSPLRGGILSLSLFFRSIDEAVCIRISDRHPFPLAPPERCAPLPLNAVADRERERGTGFGSLGLTSWLTGPGHPKCASPEL